MTDAPDNSRDHTPVSFSFRLPAYLRDALIECAFTRKTTARQIIMLGLEAQGLDVLPEYRRADRRKPNSKTDQP